ncbi:MAG: NnrU family protein [Caulobacteraceae bacterium]|nr:MAG: NnrU family protein [Caulobacteraceae bacterium]
MPMLLAAAAVFVLIHLAISGTRLRGVLVGVVGEPAYMGLFSLASIGVIVWLGMAYGAARGTGPVLWTVPDAARWLQAGLQFIALLFVVVGLLTPNPTSVKQEGAVDRPVTGMLRITRHPFLWGVTIWAAGHLLLNGDAPSLVLFGSMAVLGVYGTLSIDAKRRAALGEPYEAFMAKTANIPFAAIVQGRQPLRILELGWWRLLAAVAVWAALLWGHGMIFGVSALP